MDKTAEYQELADLYKRAVAAGEDPDQARAAYDAAVKAVATRVDAVEKPPTPVNNAVGAARAVGQGLTFGFGDEAEAAIRALSPDVDYGTAKKQIRGEMGDFAHANPKTNFALEVAGGLATGGGLRTLGAKAIPLASRAAALVGKSALAQGAIAGAGASNAETAGGVAGDAALGGALGGTLGWAAGKLSGKAAEIMQRARGTEAAKSIGELGTRIGGKVGGLLEEVPQGERAATLPARRAVTALTHRLNQGRITPEVIEAAAGSNTAQGAKIIDIGGHKAERVARGLRSVGGDAGEMIDDFATARLRTQPERMVDALYNGRKIEDVVSTTDDFIAQRGAESTPLYEEFRQAPASYSPKIEKLLKRHSLRKAVDDAAAVASDQGKDTKQIIQLSADQSETLRTPEFLDDVKKALDDRIYKGKQPGEGGMGPGAMKAAKDLRQEFVDEIDRMYPGYKAARDAWAGPTALKSALEDGVEAASTSPSPEELAKTMAGFSNSERELFQRGYLDQLRQRIENGGLKPASTEHRAFLKRIGVVFGDDSEMILTRLRDEVAATRTASFIQAGSQTIDKGAEVVDALAPEGSQAWASAIYNPLRAASNLAGRYASSRIAAPVGRETRKEVAKLLLSDATDPSVIRKLLSEMAAQNVGQKMGTAAKGAVAAETAFGFFRNPPRENR